MITGVDKVTDYTPKSARDIHRFGKVERNIRSSTVVGVRMRADQKAQVSGALATRDMVGRH